MHYQKRGSSSVGRASASQAEGHGFESRLPLNLIKVLGISCIKAVFSTFSIGIYLCSRSKKEVFCTKLHKKVIKRTVFSVQICKNFASFTAMATIKIYLDVRTVRKDGMSPLKIYISHKGKVALIGLNMYVA